MLTSILKQIWNKRRSNAWLFIELCIVFVLLWYVVDYQFTGMYVSNEPKGYDTHRVYHVSIAINPNLRDDYEGEAWSDSYLQILRQVKEYPGVESACYYGGTIPYEEGGVFQGYTVDSIHRYMANIRMVSKEFFEVFKVDMLQGSLDNWDIATYPRPAVVSEDLADSLFHGRPAIGQPAALPALLVCLNLWYADLTVNVWMDPSFFRLCVGMGGSLLLMLLMVVAGIWYPATQAMNIEPAVALHEE